MGQSHGLGNGGFRGVCHLVDRQGRSSSNQNMINQALASDQPAFYQGKSLKEHTFELQAEQLWLQALAARSSKIPR
jgi:hypothetical protein